MTDLDIKALNPSRQRRDFCKRGHPLTDDNVVQNKHGGRTCRICHRVHARATKVRQRARFDAIAVQGTEAVATKLERRWRSAVRGTTKEALIYRLEFGVEYAPDGCHLWSRSTSRAGYPMTKYGGKPMAISRVVYTLSHGPIPPGMFVCHKCDQPRCINLDHLFLGTPRDNVQDMVRKGRARNGHSQPKLTSLPKENQ